MSTTDQIVTRIKRRLSRPNDTLNTAAIIDEMVAAKERLEDEAWLPEFLYAEGTANVTAESVDLTTLFPRFIRLHDRAGGLWVPNTDPAAEESLLLLKRYDELALLIQRHGGNLASGSTLAGFFMIDTTATFRPKPSISVPGSISAKFYREELDAPAAGNSTLWTQMAADYLMGEAGIAIAQMLRDDKALVVFQATRERGKSMLQKKTLADEQAAQDYVMGDRD
jgi:hypothetical protein